MRKDSLDLLLCPRCVKGGLRVDATSVDIHFGPLSCRACGAVFAVVDGVADFIGPGREDGFRRLLETDLWTRQYEGTFRRALAPLLGAAGPDLDSEYLIYRSLLSARPLAPVLDLGCGPALFARRLVQEKAHGPTFGLDSSRAMLVEGSDQCREHGLAVDLVRSRFPPLPFRPGVLGGILHVGSLGLVADLDAFFREIARVLAPRARYVATVVTRWNPISRISPLPLGRPMSESLLRQVTEIAGLKGFERIQQDGSMTFKVERG
jgi:SAM-dependent methyltransferase